MLLPVLLRQDHSLAPIHLQAQALGDAARVADLGLEDGHLLQVEVENYDADPCWRHAGGPEDWVVSGHGAGARWPFTTRGPEVGAEEHRVLEGARWKHEH